MAERWGLARLIAVLVAATALVACGDSNGGSGAETSIDRSGPDASGAGSSTSSRTAAEGIESADGTVVSTSFAGDTSEVWVLLDVTDGTQVDGSSTVAVRLDPSALVCGDERRPIELLRLKPDTPVTVTWVPGSSPGPGPFAGSGASPTVNGVELRTACPPTREEVAEALGEQRAVWQAAGIDDYEFTVGVEVFGPLAGIYRVRVADGQPAGITPIKTYVEVTGLPIEEILRDVPDSIDGVFDEIERRLDADQIDVTYDPTYGFPVSIDFDMMLEAVDDELGLRVSDFTPSVPPTSAG